LHVQVQNQLMSTVRFRCAVWKTPSPKFSKNAPGYIFHGKMYARIIAQNQLSLVLMGIPCEYLDLWHSISLDLPGPEMIQPLSLSHEDAEFPMLQRSSASQPRCGEILQQPSPHAVDTCTACPGCSFSTAVARWNGTNPFGPLPPTHHYYGSRLSDRRRRSLELLPSPAFSN
jgi:hypothetical protein